MGVISMLFGAVLGIYQDTDLCKIRHPGITDQQAFELTMRPQGCIPKKFVCIRNACNFVVSQ